MILNRKKPDGDNEMAMPKSDSYNNDDLYSIII